MVILAFVLFSFFRSLLYPDQLFITAVVSVAAENSINPQPYKEIKSQFNLPY